MRAIEPAAMQTSPPAAREKRKRRSRNGSGSKQAADFRSLSFPAELDAIGDGKQDGFDTRVFRQFAVQRVKGAGASVLDRFNGDLAVVEHVIEENQAIGADARQNQFVVCVVFSFVGINEREIESKTWFEG